MKNVIHPLVSNETRVQQVREKKNRKYVNGTLPKERRVVENIINFLQFMESIEQHSEQAYELVAIFQMYKLACCKCTYNSKALWSTAGHV